MISGKYLGSRQGEMDQGDVAGTSKPDSAMLSRTGSQLPGTSRLSSWKKMPNNKKFEVIFLF
jgi:hypothetical protein